MVPGPVSLSRSVLEALAQDYPSGQIDADFFPLYRSTERLLQHVMETQNRVLLLSGEGMLALWSALKSAVRTDDRILVVATGFFGHGIASMAREIGARVTVLDLGYDRTITDADLALVEEHLTVSPPKMICAVHCETPSGTLNPLEKLGQLKEQYGVPLFYVDMVSSVAGCPIKVDAWHIDFALGGSQKCLSCPPSLSFVAVSERGWEAVREVKYAGYDALLPFYSIYEDGRCPYTPNWNGIAALHASLNEIFREGLAGVFRRHVSAADFLRQGLDKLGIALWPKKDALLSPTVTAARVPEGFTVSAWREALRVRGLVVAGSFGPMADCVFRIGHMGTQAQRSLLAQALDVMDDALRRR